MAQRLVGTPYDRTHEYAQHDLVEKDGELFRVQLCKTDKHKLVRLCTMCAENGRARGADRGETRCRYCNGTSRKPTQRGKQAKGYYATRGGYQVQVRVRGVPQRKWVQTEALARLLAERWLAEKAEARKAKT